MLTYGRLHNIISFIFHSIKIYRVIAAVISTRNVIFCPSLNCLPEIEFKVIWTKQRSTQYFNMFCIRCLVQLILYTRVIILLIFPIFSALKIYITVTCSTAQ